MHTSPARTLVLAFTTALFAGCSGANEPESRRAAIQCYTDWRGEVPSASALTLSVCLDDSLCSEVVTGPRYSELDDPELNPDCARERGCGNTVAGDIPTSLGSQIAGFQAYWWDMTDGEKSTGGPSFELLVMVWYPPWVSDTLEQNDRASLRVQAGTDEMLVDAVARGPYVTKVVRPYDPGTAPATCQGASLNLDGSLKEVPYPPW